MTELRTELGKRSYTVSVGHGLLEKAGELMRLDRRVLIVTDDGVPKGYAEAIAKAAKFPRLVTLPAGEKTKNADSFIRLCREMLGHGMARGDCAVAVGGGVVGDLTGFAAACYMRGIDFYNVPTTLLAQVDSSIGGKTAIDLDGTKNIVGAFHQPRHVLIDVDTLDTLPARHVAAGLAEALKMALTSDAELFALFEAGEAERRLDEVITRAIAVKKRVVEADEKESGIRKILNFGHTLGHGIESSRLGELYHGECVALGMLPMCAPAIRGRVRKVLEGLGIDTRASYDLDAALEYATHDKKCHGGTLSAIFVDEIGKYRIEEMTLGDFAKHIKENV